VSIGPEEKRGGRRNEVKDVESDNNEENRGKEKISCHVTSPNTGKMIGGGKKNGIGSIGRKSKVNY
jgi:hypothetical protein